MTDKPTTDRKIGALDSCLIVNRVISFLCDHFEDVVGLADQYRTGIAGAMDFILERGLEEAFTARAVMQQAEKEEENEQRAAAPRSVLGSHACAQAGGLLSSLGRSADRPADYERSEKDALWEGPQ